ncbi:hypothetical protein GOODEAATRI_029006, partial [Goodea atripinnis]
AGQDRTENTKGNTVDTKHLQPATLCTIMELYLDLVSPPCRAVYLFAEALKIPFEFKLVDLSAGKLNGAS